MSLNRLTNDILKRLDRIEDRLNELGQWHIGTVTVVTGSPPSVDVRLFRSTDEGSVVLTTLDYMDSYSPVVADVVVVQEWGNSKMEDGSGAFFVHGAIAD